MNVVWFVLSVSDEFFGTDDVKVAKFTLFIVAHMSLLRLDMLDWV